MHETQVILLAFCALMLFAGHTVTWFVAWLKRAELGTVYYLRYQKKIRKTIWFSVVQVLVGLVIALMLPVYGYTMFLVWLAVMIIGLLASVMISMRVHEWERFVRKAELKQASLPDLRWRTPTSPFFHDEFR
jgi:hypothetical protein